MSAKLVNVFYHRDTSKLKVGRLALDNRKIYFEYEKDFLKSGIELSPYKLPLKEGKNPTVEHLEMLGQKHHIKAYKKIITEIKNVVLEFKYYAKKVALSEKYTEEIFTQLLASKP